MAYEFVDVHSHILPSIDDGSPNVETSLKMLQKMKIEGAKSVISTSHYYSSEISLDDFVLRRDNAYNELKNYTDFSFPPIILGAEVNISKYLFHNEDLSKVCIGDTNYILIEEPFYTRFEKKDIDYLQSLLFDYKLVPILAHIERYPDLMKKKGLIEELIDMGCLTQVNVNSFVEEKNKIKKKLIKLTQENKVHFLGSDAHNLRSRPPKYKEGFEEIKSKCGEEALNRLLRNSLELIK